MKRCVLGVVLVLLAGVVEAQMLRIHGSNTVGARLAPALVEGWLESEGYTVISNTEQQPLERLIRARRGSETVAVELHAHGSSTGFRDVRDGKADVAMSSRPIKASEAEIFASLGGFDPVRDEYVVALDGIAVITHPSNPINTISKAQLARIFSGQVTDWSQAGWPDGGRIQVYSRDDNSGTFDTFASLVLGDLELVGTARRYESNAQLSDDVSRDPAGIGFTSLPNVRSSKPLSVYESSTQPLLPTPFSVATEDYALARRLFFYIPGRSRGDLAERFLEFAQSQAGQAIAEANGNVAQHLYRAQPPIPDDAPRDYTALVEGAERLSVNIRFRPGATRLDSKAERDLQRIKAFMEEEGKDRFAVMLMGFADAQETTPAFSTQLSLLRAEYIASRLQRLGIQPTRIRGYGQLLPVAANDDDTGRLKNRRVEVWVYDTETFRPPIGVVGS